MRSENILTGGSDSIDSDRDVLSCWDIYPTLQRMGSCQLIFAWEYHFSTIQREKDSYLIERNENHRKVEYEKVK